MLDRRGRRLAGIAGGGSSYGSYRLPQRKPMHTYGPRSLRRRSSLASLTLGIAALAGCGPFAEDAGPGQDRAEPEDPIGSIAQAAITPAKLVVPAAAVTASANDGNVPANTVDGDLATRWS